MASKKVDVKQRAREVLFEEFDRLTDPSVMPRAQYIEFIGEVINDLEIRQEAAQQEEKEDKERRR